MPVPDLLKEYGPAVAWFVSAIGWIVANRQANERELRKEVREEVGEVRDLVESVLSLLGEYPDSTAGSAKALKLEGSIKFTLEDLSLRIQRLGEIKDWRRRPRMDLIEATKELAKFYDAVTGADFEAAERQDDALASNHHRQCARLGLLLVDRLHKAYASGFVK